MSFERRSFLFCGVAQWYTHERKEIHSNIEENLLFVDVLSGTHPSQFNIANDSCVGLLTSGLDLNIL